ncbi:MAG: hypothetical protein ACQEXQ_08880 [Bacillota bacterium]
MKLDETEFKFSYATVSSEGLIFENRIYTNSSMIRYQWFEQAAIYGNWKIPIFYLANDLEHIFLLDATSLNVATSIENPSLFDEDLKQAYQAAICRFKELIKENKSRGDQ